MSRATRADVARKAGVSLSTVSHVMNGRGDELGFNAQTKAKVLAAARELGYVPRASARAFRYQSSSIIGLFLGHVPQDLHLPIFNEIVLSAIGQASARGYFILPVPIPPQPDQQVEQAVRQALQEIELSGAILHETPHLQVAGELLANCEIPVAWIDPNHAAVPHRHQSSFGIDEMPGLEQMLAAIDVSQVTHPVLLQGMNSPSLRHQGFLDRFSGAQVLHSDSWMSTDAFSCLDSFLRDNPHPDLIFANSDYLALGAWQALSSAQISVPDQCQIFGWGGSLINTADSTRLSSVYWPLAELTEAAIDALIKGQVKRENIATRAQLFETTRLGG